jgi:hypothetical protein
MEGNIVKKKQKSSSTRQDESGSVDPQAAPSRADLEQHLRARAWKDEAFRQELLANPQAVLERDYATWFPKGEIPSNLSFKIIEEEEQTLCFVLPHKTPDALLGMEDLDEKDLSLVGGGWGKKTKISTCGCTNYCTQGSACMCHTPTNCKVGDIGETILRKL